MFPDIPVRSPFTMNLPQGLHGLRPVVLIGSCERQSGAVCAPVRRCAPRWRGPGQREACIVDPGRGTGDPDTR